MWLPKDEVLYLIVKKEVRKFFKALDGNKFDEKNYRKCLEVVKGQIERYKLHQAMKMNNTVDAGGSVY